MSGSPSYLTIPQAVYQCYELNDGERFMLALIAFKDMPGTGCTEDNEWFARECGISPATAKRRVQKYKAMGYIVVRLTGRGRVITISDEFDDLLRGGRNRLEERSNRPEHGSKRSARKVNLTSQKGHDDHAIPYKESGKEVNKRNKAKHASNDAPEPDRKRGLPDLDDLPVEVRVQAEERVEGRKIARPHRGSPAWLDMVRAEAAQLLNEQARG